MKGRTVHRKTRRGISHESYVLFDGKWVYLGQYPSHSAARRAQAQALPLLKSGGTWTCPKVPKTQVEGDGVQPRTLVDGTVLYDITVSVQSKRDSAHGFSSQDAALVARKEWLDRINRGDLEWRPVTEARPKQKPKGASLKMDPPPPKDIRFVDYAYRWYGDRKALWKRRTVYEYRSGVSRFLNVVLATVPVRAITKEHLMAVDARMAHTNISLERRTKIRRTLAKILHSTVSDGLRTSHPATYAWCRSGKVAGT